MAKTKKTKTEEPKAEETTETKISEIKADVRAEFPSIDSEGVFTSVGIGANASKNPAPGSKAETMLKHLASLPTMRFIVPLEGDEKPGKTIYHCIMNGLTINILKGVPVTLPDQVVKHLESSFQLTMKADKENDSLLSNTGGVGKFLGKV